MGELSASASEETTATASSGDAGKAVTVEKSADADTGGAEASAEAGPSTMSPDLFADLPPEEPVAGEEEQSSEPLVVVEVNFV